MITAKYYKTLSIIENGIEEEYTDVMIIPSWLLRSILRYEEELLKEPYNSLTDYGKGIVDTLKEQHNKLSINTNNDSRQ